MLFHSSLRKELTRNFGATFVVLVTIVMTVMLIRTVGRASAGSVNPSEILLVLGYTMLGYLPIILTLGLFVAVTSALTRMYRDSEMIIWFSCGLGLRAFVRPLFVFAAPVLVVISLLAILLWPWSNQQIETLRSRYENRADIERVAPGRFIESAGGRRVFFIDRNTDEAGGGRNVFIASQTPAEESVIVARRGQIASRENGQFLVLSSGTRLDTDTANGAMRLSTFAEFDSQITARAPRDMASERPRLQSTPALLRSAGSEQLAELSWRLGLIFIAFNCVLIGLAATRVNPRIGRSPGLIFTVLAFATYYNLINVGQSWIRAERVSMAAFMLLLHGGVFALAVAWMAWRERRWHRIAAPAQATVVLPEASP